MTNTSKLQASDFALRRENFAKAVKAPIVMTANTEMQAKADMAYPFVQDASFYYLTGIAESNWMIVWGMNEWKLVRPHVSDTHALFDGSLADDEAVEMSGIGQVISTQQYEVLLKKLAAKHDSIATLGKDPHEKYYEFSLNPAQQKLTANLEATFKEVVECRKALNKLRALKAPQELQSQKEAIAVTADAFKNVQNGLATMRFEYEIEALLNSAFRANGTEGHAYTPIVAGGNHACTLHYVKNDAPLPENGLVLIDAGTQLHGYVADITRTYAIGTPTQRQIDVHAAVEKAHHKIIEHIKPGLDFIKYQQLVDDIMGEALISLGLMKDKKDTVAYRKYFPHAIGHGLGIDVHESLGGYSEMQPGMVMTVEPGIYIPEEGIGVRIEDDILVTSDGHENLSASLPTSLR